MLLPKFIISTISFFIVSINSPTVSSVTFWYVLHPKDRCFANIALFLITFYFPDFFMEKKMDVGVGHLHKTKIAVHRAWDLARFIGFGDYENFLHSMEEGVVLQSWPVMFRRISVQDDLKEGDRLRLFWQPNRICELSISLNVLVYCTFHIIWRSPSTLCGESVPQYVERPCHMLWKD